MVGGAGGDHQGGPSRRRDEMPSQERVGHAAIPLAGHHAHKVVGVIPHLDPHVLVAVGSDVLVPEEGGVLFKDAESAGHLATFCE